MNSYTLPKWLRCGTIALSTALALTGQAKVLDNFDAAQRSGWEDANPANLPLPGGQQANGQFTFNLPAIGQAFFHSSKKTSETFELQEGRTLEFRVDMVSGQGGDSFAVLGFIPQATGPNTLAGYGIAKSETDILITKGINKYFFNENVNPPVKNSNVTLVLNLTVRNGNVHIIGQVLDKEDGNRVIWERSYVDTPAADVLADGSDNPPAPFINLVGNFVLYLYGDGGTDPSGYQVVFDNAETFVTESTVLDDFNAAQRSGWEDKNPANLPLPGGQQANGQFTFDLPVIGQAFFHSSTKTTKTFELTEGTRHEFSVDMVSGQGGDSFAVLGFIPQATGANSLGGYGIAKSETDILITKGINKYFFNENMNPPLKNTNVRLVLTLTVQGGNVTVRGRVLDLDDNLAVLFDRTYVDTPAADVLSDGADTPAAPFVNLVGNAVLYLYGDGGTDPAGYQVVYDNLVVATPPAAANVAPILSEIAPSQGANFLPTTTQLTFKIADDAPIPDAGVKVTLNGTTYTTANGLSLGAAGNNRTATLGGFAADKSYSGTISVTDAGDIERTATVFFDTFTSANRIVEVEDYNFESGGYFNNPVRTQEAGGPAENSYVDRIATVDVDVSETRTAPNGSDTQYRTTDAVRMARTLDRQRPGFSPDTLIFDYDVGDLAAGEWMNYTRDFTAGTYEVFLREAVVNLPSADSVLEEVTGDATQPGQTVNVLGSFLGKTSGFTFRNVPLTDGAGLNPVRVRLSGKATLRLRTLTADNETGNRLLNYFVFVPVADSGVQRATIASLNPANGSTVETAEPKIEVAIENQDTTVSVPSIRLQLNGADVTAAGVATATGATLSYAFPTLPPKGVAQNARLVFADSDGVSQTNEWSFTVTYIELDPATRFASPGSTRGITTRVTQAQEQGESSLDRAEAQLAANSTIPEYFDTTVTSEFVNFSQEALDGGSAGYFENDLVIPGHTADFGSDNFAMEAIAYLDLPAGVTRFGVRSDDGYKLASSAAPNAGTLPLAFHNGGPADETFDVVVPQAGIYAFRLVWYERGGGAHVEWFTVNRPSGDRTLVNATGGIAAYTSAVAAPAVQLLSAATVNGAFSAVGNAVLDAGAKTLTAPLGGDTAFYRVSGGTPASIEIVGGNVVIRYQ
jgi:hypothetical protein